MTDLEPAKPPVKPAALSPEAATFWNHVLRTRPGLVRESDGPALQVLAEWYATVQALFAEVRTAPADGRLRLIQQASAASAAFERLSKRFGLAPADRPKVKATDGAVPKAARVETRPRTRLDRTGRPN